MVCIVIPPLFSPCSPCMYLFQNVLAFLDLHWLCFAALLHLCYPVSSPDWLPLLCTPFPYPYWTLMLRPTLFVPYLTLCPEPSFVFVPGLPWRPSKPSLGFAYKDLSIACFVSQFFSKYAPGPEGTGCSQRNPLKCTISSLLSVLKTKFLFSVVQSQVFKKHIKTTLLAQALIHQHCLPCHLSKSCNY